MQELNGNISRYAIYFSPGSAAPLYSGGSRWLGRDASTGESLDPQLPGDIEREEWLRVTESPCRYGFHATLKPPFRLAENTTFAGLQAALRDFADRHESFAVPPLGVAKLGNFLALTLSEPSAEFAGLAADSVEEFDRFRAPASEQELAKRLAGTLSSRLREHVLRWGYPYVFDTWKFHMSLTGALPEPSLPPLEWYLRHRFAPVCEQPLLVDSVCIFHEPYPGAVFRLVERAHLRSSL
jgi:putative phosphonate metabolism protein